MHCIALHCNGSVCCGDCEGARRPLGDSTGGDVFLRSKVIWQWALASDRSIGVGALRRRFEAIDCAEFQLQLHARQRHWWLCDLVNVRGGFCLLWFDGRFTRGCVLCGRRQSRRKDWAS